MAVIFPEVTDTHKAFNLSRHLTASKIKYQILISYWNLLPLSAIFEL
jgi:hypothetical protein